MRCLPPLPTLLRALPWALVLLMLAPAGARADEDGKIRTVVVGLEGRRNVDEALALAMSDVVQGEISNDNRRTVLGRSDLQRVLAFEAERQALGCNDDSCLTELAAALAVERIVTGSIDRIGSQYFVVITEIDAQTLEPLGRVQRRLPLDENKLIDDILSMTRQLMQESKASTATEVSAAEVAAAAADATYESPQSDAPPTGDGPVPALASAGGASGALGTVLVTTEPSGLEVLLGQRIMGVTPLKLSDVPQGNAQLVVRTLDGTELPLDVPVTGAEETRVNAKLNVPDDLSPVEQERYEEEQSSHFWGVVWKVASGAAVGLGCATLSFGSMIALGLAVGGDLVGPAFVGLTCCTLPLCAGAGLASWGAYDYFVNAPEVPLTDGKLHIVEVAPQGGEPVVFEVDADPTADTHDDEAPYDGPAIEEERGSGDDDEGYYDDYFDDDEPSQGGGDDVYEDEVYNRRPSQRF